MHEVLCNVPRIKSQFLKSLFWCLVASVCSANTRAKEWREEKKQEEGTWVQLYSRRGYLQALRLMKAYCYKNIPPTSWHETIFILSFIEFKSFFSQLLNLKLCLYTAQSEWRYVKASDLYLCFFSRGITRMSLPCRFWHDKTSPELQHGTTDWVILESATHWHYSICWAGWPHLTNPTLLKNILVIVNLSGSSYGARHSLQ